MALHVAPPPVIERLTAASSCNSTAARQIYAADAATIVPSIQSTDLQKMGLTWERWQLLTDTDGVEVSGPKRPRGCRMNLGQGHPRTVYYSGVAASHRCKL